MPGCIAMHTHGTAIDACNKYANTTPLIVFCTISTQSFFYAQRSAAKVYPTPGIAPAYT